MAGAADSIWPASHRFGETRPQVATQDLADGVAGQLDEVKQIARVIPGTVNDVVVAIVAGAVRHYLVEEDMLTDRPVVANTAVRTRKGSDTRRVRMLAHATGCRALHRADTLGVR